MVRETTRFARHGIENVLVHAQVITTGWGPFENCLEHNIHLEHFNEQSHQKKKKYGFRQF